MNRIFLKLPDLLSEDEGVNLQLCQTLILVCHAPRFDFWLQNVAPCHTAKHARRVDKILLRALGSIAKQNLESLTEDDVTIKRLRLPMRNYGAGLGSKEALAPVAYAATMVKVLRSLCDKKIQGTQITIKGFNKRMWNRLCVTEEPHYSSGIMNFIDGRSQMGTDFKLAYESLREAAKDESNEYPTSGVLRIKADEIAEEEHESVLANPQRAFTRQLDEVRKKRLDAEFKALDENDPRRSAYFNASSRSSAFLRSVAEARAESKVTRRTRLGLRTQNNQKRSDRTRMLSLIHRFNQCGQYGWD